MKMIQINNQKYGKCVVFWKRVQTGFKIVRVVDVSSDKF